MGSQCQCQLSTGRMSEDDDAAGIDGIFSCQLTKKLVARSHIFEAARPSSPGIADASIFNVPGDEARFGQRAAGKAGMREVIASAPETSMDKHGSRKMSRAFGQAQIAELVLVISVPQASVSRRRSIGEDVFAALHGRRRAYQSLSIHRLRDFSRLPFRRCLHKLA